MKIKEYLISKNKNICELDLNPDNVDNFLDLISQKINSGFNFFILSFSGLNDFSAFSTLKLSRQILAECDVLCLISGRIDFAISLKADGVFLNNNHISIEPFEEFLDENFIIATNIGAPIRADVFID